MKIIKKLELIEVVIPANSTATQFPILDQPNLRTVKLQSLQFYYEEITPFSPISQNPVINKGVLLFSFLTLQDYGGNQFLKLAPLSKFSTIENGISGMNNAAAIIQQPTIQEKDFRKFNNQYVNWPKCFITCAVPVPAVAQARSFLFTVEYEDPTEKETVPQITFAKRK